MMYAKWVLSMNSSKPSAFVAYTSKDKELSEIILHGVRKANSVKACPTRFEPWEYNDVAGKYLTSPILQGIDASPFVVADITYLNPNVVYEIGFAIGRKKKVLLIRNCDHEGDKGLTKTVGIFDTIGYTSYQTTDDLRNMLTSDISTHALPFEITVNNQVPVYIMPSDGKSSASTHLISRVKKARYRYRSFSSTEDVRLSATDAIMQVAQSAGVISMLDDNSREQTVRALFISGLADGMNKPLLLLSPYMAETPLDVRDKAKLYKDEKQIAEFVAYFCPEINANLQDAAPAPINAPNLLERVSIGDPTAENEMATLENYYLPTDQYMRAYRGEVNHVVGRKGSGKTALFIRLRDQMRNDKRNIVVDLKPESYQLLKLKDEIYEHLNEGSKEHLITAFWEYLILLEVAYKILEKDRNTYRFNHNITELYERLREIYKGNEGIAEEVDFSERIMNLSQRLSENFSSIVAGHKITAQNLTQLLYSHDLKALKISLSQYLKEKGNVMVLFDNLDKSWSTNGLDSTDATLLRCLIDASRKVERFMQKNGHQLRCILFIRNDVYQHLLGNSPDYGKEMRATLDWSDPDLLRELLRLRLISTLEEEYSEASFKDIWAVISDSHVFGEESSGFLIDRSLMRPRNVLKLFKAQFANCRDGPIIVMTRYDLGGNFSRTYRSNHRK